MSSNTPIFPLLSAARLVSIGHFLERMDVIVVFIMTLGVITKGSVYIYCGLKGMEYIFRLPYRYFTVPISMLVSCFSILVTVNYGDHFKVIQVTYYYLFLHYDAIDHSNHDYRYFKVENKKE